MLHSGPAMLTFFGGLSVVVKRIWCNDSSAKLYSNKFLLIILLAYGDKFPSLFE